jgi:hypothetical protein
LQPSQQQARLAAENALLSRRISQRAALTAARLMAQKVEIGDLSDNEPKMKNWRLGTEIGSTSRSSNYGTS